jgi:hypothetical protein
MSSVLEQHAYEKKQKVSSMGFPCAHVTVHFQVHVPAAITFSKEHRLGYKEPFSRKER